MRHQIGVSVSDYARGDGTFCDSRPFQPWGGEVILILALILILYGAQKLPGLTQRLDQRAQDAGRTLGGIYGKRAAQALTPDNQTGEL